jgi:hypothetical protein
MTVKKKCGIDLAGAYRCRSQSVSNTGYAGLHIHEPSKDDFFQICFSLLEIPKAGSVTMRQRHVVRRWGG